MGGKNLLSGTLMVEIITKCIRYFSQRERGCVLCPIMLVSLPPRRQVRGEKDVVVSVSATFQTIGL